MRLPILIYTIWKLPHRHGYRVGKLSGQGLVMEHLPRAGEAKGDPSRWGEQGHLCLLTLLELLAEQKVYLGDLRSNS